MFKALLLIAIGIFATLQVDNSSTTATYTDVIFGAFMALLFLPWITKTLES